MTTRPAPEWLAAAVRELHQMTRSHDGGAVASLDVRNDGRVWLYFSAGVEARARLRIDADGAVVVESDASGLLAPEGEVSR